MYLITIKKTAHSLIKRKKKEQSSRGFNCRKETWLDPLLLKGREGERSLRDNLKGVGAFNKGEKEFNVVMTETFQKNMQASNINGHLLAEVPKLFLACEGVLLTAKSMQPISINDHLVKDVPLESNENTINGSVPARFRKNGLVTYWDMLKDSSVNSNGKL